MATKVTAHRRRRTTYQKTENYASSLLSEQIFFSLNELLAIAVAPVFEYTEFSFDLCLSLMAASMDKRRKVSIHSSDVCRGILTHCLIFQSGKDILNTLQKIGVERNLITDPIMDAITLNELPAPMLASSPFSKEAMLRHIRQCMQPYFEFRKEVAERFIKLAEAQGRTNAWVKSQSGLISDENEHANNYMLSVFRAIDKFYPNRGTLASYVTSWMENAAGSNYSVYLGEAFVIPRSHRRQAVNSTAVGGSGGPGNFSLPLEEAVLVTEVPQNIENHDNVQLLHTLYQISVLFPAMLQNDFPAALSTADYRTIMASPNTVDVPPSTAAHIFNAYHAATIIENVNFSKTEKRRKR